MKLQPLKATIDHMELMEAVREIAARGCPDGWKPDTWKLVLARPAERHGESITVVAEVTFIMDETVNRAE